MSISKKDIKIIDLRILNEGLFRDFLIGVIGFIAGKHSLKTKIKGTEEQISTLTDYLKAMKKSGAEKDRLINKLMTLQASTSNVSRLKDEFFHSTGVKLP